jgi:hypothetical protein
VLAKKLQTLRGYDNQEKVVRAALGPPADRPVYLKEFASSIAFGEHQVMAQLIAKRVLISPLMNKDFPVRHPLLALSNVASVNLNHQKRR